MRFSLLLADADNTLYDFDSAERAAFATVSARFHLLGDEAHFTLYRTINRRHWQKLRRGETTAAALRHERFRDFADALGLKYANVQAMSDLYVQALSRQQATVEGAEAFLRRVSAQMPVCLVTNGFSDVQRPRFESSPLRPYISDILISEEYARGKPHPGMILDAMKRMQIADKRRVVLIGDNEDTDIQAAVNACIQSVLFLNGAPPPPRTNATYTAATLKEAADWILAE